MRPWQAAEELDQRLELCRSKAAADLLAQQPVVLVLGGHGGAAASVGDDGVGLPEGFDVHSGGNLGWRVIRALSRQLDADLQVDSSPLGLKVTILLPR